MSNLWGAYAGNIVTNHKTAFFVSTNHRAWKVPRRGREGEIIDIKKAPLLRIAALKRYNQHHENIQSKVNEILYELHMRSYCTSVWFYGMKYVYNMKFPNRLITLNSLVYKWAGNHYLICIHNIGMAQTYMTCMYCMTKHEWLLYQLWLLYCQWQYRHRGDNTCKQTQTKKWYKFWD